MDMLKITGYHNRAFPKKGAIRGAVSRRLAWMQHHKVFVLFFFGYLAAFCCGTFFHEEGESFSPLLQTNFLSRMQQPFWMGFLSFFAIVFLWEIGCFLFGLSLWGWLFSPWMLFFRGYGAGVVAGSMVTCYGLGGVFGFLLIFLPGMAVEAFAFLLETVESTSSSFSFFRNHSDRSFLRRFIRRTLITTLILLISSLLQFLGCLWFGSWFLSQFVL